MFSFEIRIFIPVASQICPLTQSECEHFKVISDIINISVTVYCVFAMYFISARLILILKCSRLDLLNRVPIALRVQNCIKSVNFIHNLSPCIDLP